MSIEEFKPRHDDRAEHLLKNLLALIYRDGGHYTQDHGLVKATQDAEGLIVRMRSISAAADILLEGVKEDDPHALGVISALNTEMMRKTTND